MDRRSRFRRGLHDLYLPFYDALCGILPEHWQPVSGFRSFEEQSKLYNQGRRTDGDIVTKARPGESFHNYGLASDWAYFPGGKYTAIPAKDIIWQEYIDACAAVGVRCLAWERPHNEYALKLHVKQLFKVYQIDGEAGVERLLKGG